MVQMLKLGYIVSRWKLFRKEMQYMDEPRNDKRLLLTTNSDLESANSISGRQKRKSSFQYDGYMEKIDIGIDWGNFTEIYDPTLWRALLGEFIATAMLLWMGLSAALFTGGANEGSTTLSTLEVAFTFGFAVSILVYTFAGIKFM